MLPHRSLQWRTFAEGKSTHGMPEGIRGWVQVTPDDPRLWCALGDLTLKEEHYETAWQRSKHRSTRAQRSLARSAQREKDHEKACVVPRASCFPFPTFGWRCLPMPLSCLPPGLPGSLLAAIALPAAQF